MKLFALFAVTALAATLPVHADDPPPPPTGCLQCHTPPSAVIYAGLKFETPSPESELKGGAGRDLRPNESPRPGKPSSTLSLLALILSGGIGIGALRNIVDANLIFSVNFAAAGASAQTVAIDIGTGPHVDDLEIRIATEAAPALVDAKTLTVTLQDSADGTTDWQAIPGLSTLVVTGAGGVGAAAAQREVRLPSIFRGFLRGNVDTLAAAGDNTAKKLTLTVLT